VVSTAAADETTFEVEVAAAAHETVDCRNVPAFLRDSETAPLSPAICGLPPLQLQETPSRGTA